MCLLKPNLKYSAFPNNCLIGLNSIWKTDKARGVEQILMYKSTQTIMDR